MWLAAQPSGFQQWESIARTLCVRTQSHTEQLGANAVWQRIARWRIRTPAVILNKMKIISVTQEYKQSVFVKPVKISSGTDEVTIAENKSREGVCTAGDGC